MLKTTPKKAAGSSGITYHMTQHLPPNTITAITHIYNAQLASGYFPELFKTATATLIPKPNKTNTNPLNYRPISLLEIFGKTFERIINRRLRTYLETEDLLSQKHFGFRPQRSTQSALNVITDYLYITKNRRLKTALITKDITKAFDTVWHEGLKYKLCTQFNFPIIIQRLLCHYLSDRKMRIKFKDKFSDYFVLRAGVPQGSVLAPTLFILYTNDLPDPTRPLSITIQYADDVTQLISAYNYRHLHLHAQQELDQVTEWEHKWRIQTNKTKAQLTYFPPHHRDINIQLDTFTAPAHYIPKTNTNKVLGLNYDNILHIHKHTQHKAAYANTCLQQLYRFRSTTPKTKLHLYKALILPHLTYSPLTLSLAYTTNIRKLQVIQNKALRFVYNIHYTEHRTNKSLHEQAHIPPLNIRWRHMIDNQLDRLRDELPYWYDFMTNLTGRFGPRINLFNIVDSPFPDEQY